MKVKDVMTAQIDRATENSPIQEVARFMKERDIGAVPICNDRQQPIGIVTDRDMVIRGIVSGVHGNEPVHKIMSKNPVCATPQMDVHEAAEIMASRQIRRLPVVEEGRIVGMVSLGDLAVTHIHENEAGMALGSISQPAHRPLM